MRKLLVALALLMPLTAKAETFRAYKGEFIIYRDETKKNFSSYRQQIDREFEAYKRQIKREFKRYKLKVWKKWYLPFLPSRHIYVEYSKDLNRRIMINFRTGKFFADFIAKPNLPKAKLDKKFKKILIHAILENEQQALKENELLRRLEKRALRFKYVKFSKNLSREKIIGDVLTGKENPSVKDATKCAEKILSKAKITTRKSKVKGKVVYSLSFKIPSKKFLIKAKHYVPLVSRYSKIYKISPSLLLAIIHTESAFDPLATSPIPAYGLMQIVPQSAGKEYTSYFWGKPVLLAPSFLYKPSNNVKTGGGYLYILYHRYFRGIKNPESRLYCAVAAYNTGPGNVARAFTGRTDIDRAVRIINRLTPKQVFNILESRLPYYETRRYVKIVLNRKKFYEAFLKNLSRREK